MPASTSFFDLKTADSAESAGHAQHRPTGGEHRPVAAHDHRGKIDLPSGIFFALLGTGIYQLARGRFIIPPWYTAFWYAFGLVSMYVIEKAAKGGAARQAD